MVSRVSYTGTVESIEDEWVVLADAAKSAEMTDALHVPLIGNLYESTAIGREMLEGSVRVGRETIVAIDDLSIGNGVPHVASAVTVAESVADDSTTK